MIGPLYDLAAFLAERRELGRRRAALVADLEGDVLEIGAGTGATLPHYRRAASVVALEPSESMARRMRAKASAAAVPVRLVRGVAEELPFPDESFDAVVSTLVLCSVADPARALAEVRRVLRPGGRLVLLEHVRAGGRLGRWQDRLTPLHRRLAGNCHLNRDTAAAADAAGFDVSGLEPAGIPAHPLARRAVQGAAIKTSS